MNALNDKDSQIADITKERDEAINNLPSPREIIGQGRRMHGLFNNIKDLEANHKGSYPENALRLLMKQSKMQYF
ncbi:MAG: hypothetical protein LBD75_01805 [Candidatus Peribacteria bacterium]|jgi:hypothetical protein|nr:hypothetical protein [Candidatus Peribacteria bacterium]